MAKITEVAVKAEGGAVAIMDDELLAYGTGLEEVTPDDVSIPFIQILQALSPQLNKNDGKYIKGAEQGNIHNSVLNTVVDGDEGIIVVPCYYNKKYLEWTPREAGGGKVAEHDSRDILSLCTKNDRGQMVLSNGNYIAETAQFFVMVCNENETEWSQAAIEPLVVGPSKPIDQPIHEPRSFCSWTVFKRYLNMNMGASCVTPALLTTRCCNI